MITHESPRSRAHTHESGKFQECSFRFLELAHRVLRRVPVEVVLVALDEGVLGALGQRRERVIDLRLKSSTGVERQPSV